MVDRRPNVAEMQARVAEHADAIRSLYKKPSEVRVTIVVRCPWIQDADTLVTNDGLSEAVAAATHLEAVEGRCRGHGGRARGGPCCGHAGEYNGFGSDGPLTFKCPKSCDCHD